MKYNAIVGHIGAALLALFILLASNRVDMVPASVSLDGELRKWHRLTLSLEGPFARETDDTPNPFLDYRLQVIFTGPSGQTYNIPGFFDGNGRGESSGNIWRVHFSPDEAGEWQYDVSFRQGPGIAIELDADAGIPVGFDGASGTFSVMEADVDAPEFFRWGRLEYVGEPYLKFRDGPYWLKGGTDSPENFLAYEGFDNTVANHRFQAHLDDWQEGDPDWGNGRGQAIIGALNYLSSQHVNSIYFLPMNIGGDGKDTWPFAGQINAKGHRRNDNLHYDISKLYQWEIVFTHAQRKGIHLYFVLNEGEESNKRELDDATLGIERRLYYRELVARFGHHNALTWNLSEEYNFDLPLDPEEVKQWAGYLRAVDPYNHPITVHNYTGGEPATIWPQEALAPFLGNDLFDTLSIQFRPDEYDPPTLTYSDLVSLLRQQSTGAGRPLPVFIDESDRASTIDGESHEASFPMMSGHSYLRKATIWPVYMSGGSIEIILEDLLGTEDFRRYESLWQYLWYARRFFDEELPFWEMKPGDNLLVSTLPYYLNEGQVLGKVGEVYAVYLPKAGWGSRLDLRHDPACFRWRWYNPRHGRFEGNDRILSGGRFVNIGPPPGDPLEDWAILIRATALQCHYPTLKSKR